MIYVSRPIIYKSDGLSEKRMLESRYDMLCDICDKLNGAGTEKIVEIRDAINYIFAGGKIK